MSFVPAKEKTFLTVYRPKKEMWNDDYRTRKPRTP